MLNCCFPKTHGQESNLDQVFMTKEEYEREYRAAIASLEQRGHRVGSPYVSKYGVRSVRVDSFPWTDDAVSEEAWGKELLEDA